MVFGGMGLPIELDCYHRDAPGRAMPPALVAVSPGGRDAVAAAVAATPWPPALLAHTTSRAVVARL